MKKIIIGIFSLVVLFVLTSNVFAVSFWNGASNDCKTVSIAVHETQEGWAYPCWPGTTVTATPGQSVNVRIYYHNTGTTTANNTKLVLNAPTINSKTTSHSFTGQIVSDQGSSSSFTVRANLSSAQKLNFSSVNWYTENTNETNTNLLYGQTGEEVVNGGLRIGSIAPGWSTQGSIVVTFHVDNPQPTGTLTAATDVCYVQAGKSTCDINFNWSTENPIGTSTVTRDGGGTVATSNSGSKAFSIPFNGATFRLLNNNITLDTESVNAMCAQNTNWNGTTCALPLNDCDLKTFIANPTSSSPRDPVTLSWTSNYCKSVSISNEGSNFSPNGSKVVYPSTTTNYLLTGYGDTSVQPTMSVTVVVGGPAGAPTFPAGAPTFGA